MENQENEILHKGWKEKEIFAAADFKAIQLKERRHLH